MDPKSALNTQIATLYKNGCSVDQIAHALGLQLQAVDLILKGLFATRKKQTLQERYGDVEDLVVQTYISVMQNSENDSARVRAAELLDTKITHGGSQEFDYDTIVEQLKEANKIVSTALVQEKTANVIDLVTG